MYYAVYLVEEDCYSQCFLWRDMEGTKEPVTYQVVVNNIGVKLAGAIATMALHKSADLHEQVYPVVAQQIKHQSYVDDIALTDKDKEKLRERVIKADKILEHANMVEEVVFFQGRG
jgi:hypothetical protein